MKNIIEDTFDIFLISKTNVFNSFPNSQFSINRCKMFRCDRNDFGGGLCLYVKDSIASKQLNSHKENIDVEAVYLEINIQKRKWFIISTYKPLRQNIVSKICSNIIRQIFNKENICRIILLHISETMIITARRF